MKAGLGQFDNGDEIVYVGMVGNKLHNFNSLDWLREFFLDTCADTPYDLDLPQRIPRVYPLSPEDKEYVTSAQK